MTRTTINLFFATAALAVATSAASAQSLKADIPFAFRLGNNVYPAGTYRVDVTDAHTRIYLLNTETHRTAITIPTATSDASRAWRDNGAPMMAFECGLGRCQLTKMWTGQSGTPALELPRPKSGRDEVATLRLIQLSRNGD
jgi:hypothetical protein